MHNDVQSFSVTTVHNCVLQWCAQTIPKCGTYQQNLVGLLLPAVAQVATAQATGQTQEEALSTVLPPLLEVCSFDSSNSVNYFANVKHVSAVIACIL